MFTGFERGALAQLAELPGVDADAYSKRKAGLKTGLVEPAKQLILEVAQGFGPELTVDPRRSLSPLHTDLRFAKPGSARYKDHLLLTTWQGADKATAPTLWIRLAAEGAGFASGVAFTPALRDRWRERVAGDPGKALAKALTKIGKLPDAEVAGDLLKKVPAPYDPDHPRGELLRKKGFQVRYQEPLPATVDRAAFAGWCLKRLERLRPVHEWLVSELSD